LTSENDEKSRIANKLRRKQEKEASRKADEIKTLKEQIQTEFISKAVVVEGITMNEIVDSDGFGIEGKPQLMALGGFLGQLMIVMNTISKHYSKYDAPADIVDTPRE